MTTPPDSEAFKPPPPPPPQSLPDDSIVPREVWRDVTVPLFVVDTLADAEQLSLMGFPSVGFEGLGKVTHLHLRDRHICFALSSTPEEEELALLDVIGARTNSSKLLKLLSPHQYGAQVRRARLKPPNSLLTIAQQDGKNGVLRFRIAAPLYLSDLDDGAFARLCKLVERQRDESGHVLLDVRAEGAGLLRWNEMSQSPVIGDEPVADADIARLRRKLSSEGHDYRDPDLWSATAMVAQQNKYHPVRTYLRTLVWDGTERIRRIAVEILKANYESPEDRALNERMLYCFLLGAVARAFEPGCTMQTSLVLVGPQGALKSTFFRVLASDSFFCDSNLDIHNTKDTPMVMGTAWIIEWAELETLRRARELTLVKSFMSSPQDTFRPPWGRSPVRLKRSSVFVGTTNDAEFLTDSTGNRRWHLVSTGSNLDLEKLREWRDQLWAEAVARYDAGARDWFLSHEENRLLADRQDREHYAEHPWAPAVLRWLHKNNRGEQLPVTIERILTDAIDKELSQTTPTEQRAVGAILRKAGWEKERKMAKGDRKNVWLPPANWKWEDSPQAGLQKSDADDSEPF